MTREIWHRWYGATSSLVCNLQIIEYLHLTYAVGETARRMDCYAGEVQNLHPFFDYDSPARAKDLDLATTKAYALPGNLTAGIQHGSWTLPVEGARAPKPSLLNSHKREIHEDLKYSKRDIEHIEEWVKRHVETTWHSLGVSEPSFKTHCVVSLN